jgi:hypothetical protein
MAASISRIYSALKNSKTWKEEEAGERPSSSWTGSDELQVRIPLETRDNILIYLRHFVHEDNGA